MNSMTNEIIEKMSQAKNYHVYEEDYFYRDCLEIIRDEDRQAAAEMAFTMSVKQWDALGETATLRSYRCMLMHMVDTKNKVIGCGIKPRNIINSLRRTLERLA